MPMLISWAEVAAIAICVVASIVVLDVRCSVIFTGNDNIGSVCVVGAGDDGAPDGCVDGSALGGTVATE